MRLRRLPTSGTAVSEAVRALYPNVQATREGEAVRRCASSEQQRYDDDVRNRQKLLDDARAMWRAVARTPARGSCTALDFAVRRAMGRSRHVLVLSDGANTCATPRVQSSPRLITGQTLTLLLLPRRGLTPQRVACGTWPGSKLPTPPAGCSSSASSRRPCGSRSIPGASRLSVHRVAFGAGLGSQRHRPVAIFGSARQRASP